MAERADDRRLARALAAVRRLRHRQIIDRIDYLRGLRRLADRMTQSDLANALGLTQPSISSALKSAAKIDDPPKGFCGASVYEIAERFTAGEIDREALVDQLSRWPAQRPDRQKRQPVDNQPEVPPDLGKALRHGLLDDSAYQAVLQRRRTLGRPSRRRPRGTRSQPLTEADDTTERRWPSS